MANRRETLIQCREDMESPEGTGSRDLVSSELGISKVYLRMLENGTFKPGRDLMLKISKYYKKPPEVLFPDLFEDHQVV